MDAPKLLVITLAILVASFFIFDVITATILRQNMQNDIKRHMLYSMNDSIHLGDLRRGNLTLDQEKFIDSWQQIDNPSYHVNVEIVKESPALVTVEGIGRVSLLSRWLGVSDTPMTVKYVAIVDLREEGRH